MPPPGYAPPPAGGYGGVPAGLTAYMYAPGAWQPYVHATDQIVQYEGVGPSGMIEGVREEESPRVVEVDGKVR